MVGALYDLCKLTYLKNPQQKFKLVDTTIIAYAVINATLTLARDVLYDQLIEWIEISPYFRGLANKSSGRSRFPKGIDIVPSSRSDQVMGRAIVGAILDEMNYQTRVSNQAYDNYNAVRARVESRFLGRGGSWPAHMWLVSSKSDETGWLQTHIDRMKDIPTVRIFEYPIWDVLVDKGIYSGVTFKMFIGDKTRDPFLVERPEQISGVGEHLIIDVPVEYKQNFVNDPFRSLQDLAGAGTWSARNFLGSSELIEECQVRDNPVTQTVITLDFYDKSQKLIDYLIYHQLTPDTRARFIHIDLGLRSDKTGIASTRFDGYVTMSRFDPTTGMIVKAREPVYFTDWVMAVEAKAGHEVPIYKIKEMLIELRSRGYPIAKVSMDGYQSVNLRQDLSLLGFESEEISVDRKKDAYYNFKNAIMESRYNGVRHAIFDEELRSLLELEKKIDHPTLGSKDVCLRGDTKIKLLRRGCEETIENLYEKMHGENSSGRPSKIGEWVNSVDVENNKIVPGLVVNVKRTRLGEKKLMRITLENGKKVECTEDHLFMIGNRKYLSANKLQVGISLMSSVELIGVTNVEYVESVANEYVYDLVMESYHNFRLSCGVYVHNCDAVAGSLWSAYQDQDQYANVMSPGEYMAAFEKYAQDEENYYETLLRQAASIHTVYKQ